MMSIEKRGSSWSVRVMNPLTNRRERITVSTKGISKTEFQKIVLQKMEDWERTLQGLPTQSEQNCEHPFLIVANDWIKGRTVGKYTKNRHTTLVLEFEEFIGEGAVISSVTPQTCRDFLGLLEKVKNHSPETRRKEFSILKSIFEFALNEGYLSTNPWRRVEAPKVPEGKTDYLTEQEFRKLLDVAGTLEKLSHRKGQDTVVKARRLRYAFLAYTGARRGEAQAVRWGDVDFEVDQIRIQNAQKGKGTKHQNRHIPIHPDLRPLLTEAGAGKDPTDYVFPYHENWLREIKSDARKAGIQHPVTIHMLRHTFGSWLAQNGASPYEIRDLMGHQTVKTSDRYTHLSAEHLRGAICKIGNFGPKMDQNPKKPAGKGNGSEV